MKRAAQKLLLLWPVTLKQHGPGVKKFFASFGHKRSFFLRQRAAQKKKPGQSRVFQKPVVRRAGSALTGFHPWVLLVDDVDPAMATHNAAILVASFRGLQGVTDLHHKLSGKMFKRWRDMPGGGGNVNLRGGDFDVMKGSFAFALIPLLKAKLAANAADSPRSRDIL